MSTTAPPTGRRWLPIEFLALLIGLLIVLLLVVDLVGSHQEARRLDATTRTALDALVAGEPDETDSTEECVVQADEAPSAASVRDVCKVKAQLPRRDVRVRIVATDDEAFLCTMVAQRSMTGVLGAWRSGRIHTARARVETDDVTTSLTEAPLHGGDWDFCPAGGADRS